jgi:ribosomal subunit interface protein
MNVIVSGKHVDVGDSLKQYMEEKLNAIVAKYLDKVNTVHVVLSKEGHLFRVDITSNLATHAGLTLQSRTDGVDPYGAFDAASEKIEKQLRRYKRQITRHHVAKVSDIPQTQKVSSKHYVISSEDHVDEVPDNPLIIAEKADHIEHLTVSDAVMRMDLGELSALVFINEANNRLNVIYRRNDGHIAWVDPEIHEARSLVAA